MDLRRALNDEKVAAETVLLSRVQVVNGAREMRAKPESRAKPDIERMRGLGRVIGEPVPRNFLKMHT